MARLYKKKFIYPGHRYNPRMNAPPLEKKQSYLSVRRKIWFIFLLVFIPAYVIMDYSYYRFMVSRELEILTVDLTHHVDGIIATINAEDFRTLYEEEVRQSEYCPPKPGTAFSDPKNGYYPEDNQLFQEHMEWIRSISAIEPKRSVYTYVIGPEKDYVITIGSSWYFTNPKESFKFCQLYKAPNMYKGLFNRLDRWDPYQDEFGYWISSYTPIKDKNGVIVGAVGVDIPASQITDIRNSLLLSSVLLLLGIVLVSFVIAYGLTRTISTPLSSLTTMTVNIKNSKSGTDFVGFNLQRGKWRDEIDILSESMQNMMIRLNKQNEKLLQSRVEMQELARGVIRAQENERKYISRELHNEAGQLLAMLKTTMDDILLDLPGNQDPEQPTSFDSSAFQERIAYAARQIEETLGVVRSISHQMRPSLLDVGDVNLALNEYCKEFSQRQKIKVIYDGFIIPNPPEEIAVSFYRFLQEALTNVPKHSSATVIWVRAQMDGDWMQMSVEDNGRERKSTQASGIGIAGLKERFFLLGGTVEARTVSGGFLVVARVPLKRA